MIQRSSTPPPQSQSQTGSRNQKPAQAAGEESNLHPGIAVCEVCGNDYDKPLEIVTNGISHYFDCFECAIHALAPKCAHCECRIIGHGVEAGGVIYCCAHCAAKSGSTTIRDHA